MTQRPWITGLDRQTEALRYSRWISNPKREPPKESAQYLPWLAGHVSKEFLGGATLFLWHEEPAQAVQLASHSVPEDVGLAAVPLPEGAPSSWWYFDTPIPLGRVPGEMDLIPEPGIDVDFTCLPAVLLAKPYFQTPGHGGRDGLVIVLYRSVRVTVTAPLQRMVHLIPTFAVVGEMRTTIAHIREQGMAHAAPDKPVEMVEALVSLSQFLIAGCAWLHQRIVTTRHEPIERHARKRIAREFAIEAPMTVRVVELRRHEVNPHGPGDGSSVEWSCRWVVSGHWRNQAVKEGHRLTYVESYLKGPADKPLKVPETTIYEVKR